MSAQTIGYAILAPLALGLAAAAFALGRRGARLGTGLGVARERALEALGAGMVVIDRRGRVTSSNNQARILLGLKSVRTAEVSDSVPVLAALCGIPELATLLAAGEGGAEVVLGAASSRRRIEARAFHFGRAGRGTVLLLIDVTVNAALLEELSALASLDGLTGVYNRRRFDELGMRDIELARRSGKSVGVLMLDIDFFKRVNDERGHSVGDELLKAICLVSKEALRSTDIFARYGGEEFAVLLPSSAQDESVAIAERLRTRIAAFSMPCQGGNVSVTVSLGAYSGVPAKGEDLGTFLKRADEALYWSKTRGRDKVSYWKPIVWEEA